MKKVSARKLGLLVIASLFLIACKIGRNGAALVVQEQEYINDSTVVIPFDEVANNGIEVPISQFMEAVRYVQLEFSPESAIGTISKIKVVHDLIYIEDLDERLLCFNNLGQFVRNCYHQGRGPKEVVQLYDFEIDHQYLYLLDGTMNRIQVFDHNGNYVKTMDLPFRAVDLNKNGDGWRFFLSPYTMANGNAEYLVCFTDSSFNAIKNYIEYPLFGPTGRTSAFENSTSQRGYFAPIFGKGIYRVDAHGMTMEYYLDLHSDKLSDPDHWTQAAERKIWFVYNNPFSDKEYLYQYFWTSLTQKGLLVIRKRDGKCVFVRDFIADGTDVLSFDWMVVNGYDNERGEFYGQASVLYTEGYQDDPAKLELLKNSISEQHRHALFVPRSYDANPTLMFFRTSSAFLFEQ